jgi:hypothetical protein
MRIRIENTWFPAGTKIRIGRGADELVFLRCFFEGGEIFVEHDVDGEIFSQCVFQGTIFSGQPLSRRIATQCHSAPVETEAAAAGPAASRRAKFRR